MVDFRTDRLFSYTFWLCSLNSVTQTPFGSRATRSHDPSHPRREPAIGLIAVDLHAKGTKLAALKKVTSFVFKHFLASFPRFSCFLAVRWIALSRAILDRSRSPTDARAKTCKLLQSSNSAFNPSISTLNYGSF